MLYSQCPEPAVVVQIARLRIEGHSEADIAASLNLPVTVVEDLPFRFPMVWLEAVGGVLAVVQQEAMLKALLHVQATLAKTTDPKALATLVNALARLLSAQQALAKKNKPARPEADPVPVAIPEAAPVEKVAEIQAALSPAEQQRYMQLRRQFSDFNTFVAELRQQEPVMHEKLNGQRLLPQEFATPLARDHVPHGSTKSSMPNTPPPRSTRSG